MAVCNALCAVSSLFVIQRLAYKVWAKLGCEIDDWLIIAALSNEIATNVINCVGLVPNGMGRDIWTLTYSNITNFGLFFYVEEIFYISKSMFVKLALLFFYIRVFPSHGVRWLLWSTVSLLTLVSAVFIFTAIFQCSPVSYFWQKWDGQHVGQCLDSNAVAWSNATINIAFGCWMLAIPLWQLKSLHMDWKRKVAVTMMFCIGSL
jgi:hypothetical protein